MATSFYSLSGVNLDTPTRDIETILRDLFILSNQTKDAANAALEAAQQFEVSGAESAAAAAASASAASASAASGLVSENNAAQSALTSSNFATQSEASAIASAASASASATSETNAAASEAAAAGHAAAADADRIAAANSASVAADNAALTDADRIAAANSATVAANNAALTDADRIAAAAHAANAAASETASAASALDSSNAALASAASETAAAGHATAAAGSASEAAGYVASINPSQFAQSVHNHAIADVTGLQTALDGKSNTGHGHVIADVTELQARLEQAAPAGKVDFFAMSSAPSGWLKANGAAVSRTVYADLFEAIGTSWGEGDGSTTFNLPDLRGEFIRGWDDGRGVDSGRSFGSQQSATRVYGAAQQPGAGWGNSFYDADLIPAYDDDGVAPDVAGTNGYNNRGAAGTAGWLRYGRYVRPRNRALLACIKF